MDFLSLIQGLFESGTWLVFLALLIRKVYDLIWVITASKIAEELSRNGYDIVGISKQGVNLVRDKYSRKRDLVGSKCSRKGDLLGHRYSNNS